MRIVHNKLEGDFILDDELALHGQATGNVVVSQGGILHLHGMCSRDLTVNRGGRAIIHGMVCGNVVNDGGEVEILGTIIGTLQGLSDAARVDPKASVRGGLA